LLGICLNMKKFERHKSDEYLSWIRSKECCICGARSEPHHVDHNKPNDFMTIPLCRKHHSELHALENKKQEFEKKYGFDLERYVVRLLIEYIEGGNDELGN